MKSKDFQWKTNEFMLHCRSTQLREKTMSSYEQSLRSMGLIQQTKGLVAKCCNKPINCYAVASAVGMTPEKALTLSFM